MKYALFAGDTYYPAGGVEDFVGWFESLDEAEAEGVRRRRNGNWWHVTDANLKMVKESP